MLTYAFTVGVPSALILGPWKDNSGYYSAPWETMADVLGGARSHSSEEIERARAYYNASVAFPPFAIFWWLK